MRPAATLLLPFLFLCAAAPAPTADETPLLEEVKILERRVAPWATLRRLEIDAAQARGLVEVAREALREQAAHDEKLARLHRDQRVAFASFRKEDLANLGFTPLVERVTGQLEHRETTLTKEFRDRINALGTRASFTNDQLARLAHLRRDSKKAFFAPGPPRPNEPDARAALETELAAIHKERHGDLGPVGRFLLLPGMFEALCERGGIEPGVAPGTAGAGERDEELHALREEINLLNLMNGMNYTPEQLDALARLSLEAKACASERRPSPADAPAADLTRYRDELAAELARLRAGDPADPQALGRLQRLRARCGIEPERDRAPKRAPGMERILGEALGVFTDCQKQVLLGYKPCLIPPKDLKDPVRVGQASDGSRMVEMLVRLRGVPKPIWAEKREAIVEGALAKLEEGFGAFPADERDGRKRDLGAILDDVRALEDVDFELQKGDLVKLLEPFKRKEVLEAALTAQAGERSVLEHKIRTVVLHPRAAALYEARAAQVRNPTARPATDLGRIDAADNCKDGSCALDE